VSETVCVPDKMDEIQHQITAWTDSDQPPNLILTTGGTGFSISDVTPEVSYTMSLQHQLYTHADGPRL